MAERGGATRMVHFSEIKVWQRAHKFALKLYVCTKSFPTDERFGIVSQIRRAAVSVAINIAEGSKKKGHVDFARYVNMSEGSAGEVEALLLLSRDLSYISIDVHRELSAEVDEIQRMLHSFRSKLEAE
jgi:four helix bundle protein